MTDATVEAARPRGGTPGALLKAMRPRQWVKNLLVLAAPVFSGQITDVHTLVHASYAFIAFCMVSSSVYLINDTRDIAEDRAHPRKRFRPIAAGFVPANLAVTAAGFLMALSVVFAWLVTWQLGAVIVTYAASNLAYCLALKDEPVIDIAIIASGFLLRAVAGGAAAGITLSQWFLLIASFGSLFMAAGKRYAEVVMVGEGQAATRRSLQGYSASYLRFVWSVAAALLLMSYALWAFALPDRTAVPYSSISMAPFVLAVLRYAVDVDAGRAGEPEEIALGDRVLQALAVLWAVLVGLAVYLN